MSRRPDETALSSVTILKIDDRLLDEICEKALERPTKVYLARLFIHYGVRHMKEISAWYGEQADRVAQELLED